MAGVGGGRPSGAAVQGEVKIKNVLKDIYIYSVYLACIIYVIYKL